MRILFVDDEPRVLQGLERMFYGREEQWSVSCAENGNAALNILDDESFDVVVTDIRMPGMDGATLLEKIHQRYPEVIRIVLTGYAEIEAAVRAVPVAHQFLTKPCDAGTLEGAILRAHNLQELLSDKDLRRLVGRIQRLPSIPAVYADLTRALADPKTDAQAISAIVERDPAMCAKLLQVVNSSFFSRGARCTDVDTAVMRLGFQMVKTLVLSVEVFRVSGNLRAIDGFSIESLQQHALHAAAVARKLVKDKQECEDAFMAAMLHDVGKLILAMELPHSFGEALIQSQEEGIPLHVAERRVVGASHAELGAYLLSLWGLPVPVVEAVGNHHHPARVPGNGTIDVLAAVHIANGLCGGTEMDADYVRRLGVSDRLDRWRDMAENLKAF